MFQKDTIICKNESTYIVSVQQITFFSFIPSEYLICRTCDRLFHPACIQRDSIVSRKILCEECGTKLKELQRLPFYD